MQSQEIEAWGLRVIDAVVSGAPTEDSRVELKADWIDANPAARRIAGLCNAARAEWVMFVIGVDEKNRIVTGVNANDFATWWAKVKAEFDGPVPRCVEVATRLGNQGVMLVAFETDRRPFVVRNEIFGRGGSVEREVPWREGTAIRSATHEDLIRMLSPMAAEPLCELIFVRAESHAVVNGPRRDMTVEARFYIVPRSERFVIPFYRCSVGVRQPPAKWVEYRPAEFTIYDKQVVTMQSVSKQGIRTSYLAVPQQQVTLDGPCTLATKFNFQGKNEDFVPSVSLEFIISFQPIDMPVAVTIRSSIPFLNEPGDGIAIWQYNCQKTPHLPD